MKRLGWIIFLLTLKLWTYSADMRAVDKYGQLRVEGTQILASDGKPVALEGMSLFWSQWIDKYYNYKCLKWLRDDWNCEIIRAALAVEHNGYLKKPDDERADLDTVVNACLKLGMYVIIDWHSHKAENTTSKAVEFFSEISKKYGHYPNIIYEIYNEPLKVSWENIVKPYHLTVIEAIRKNDPDNIIILGTPSWSQDVDIAADEKVEGDNLAYSLHFYAGTHTQWLRDKAQIAIDKGLALWVTEFGTCNSDGNGPIAYEELERWFDFMEKNSLSWCNWSVSDKRETSAALLPGASEKGQWQESQLSESGILIRKKLKEINP